MFTYLDSLFHPIQQVPPLAAAYAGRYNPGLVLLSLLIAILASYGTLSISERISSSNSRLARFSWLSAGAASMGFGIWAMHFVGMLAFSLPCSISYAPWLTVLSILPGVIASGVALELISRRDRVPLGKLALGAVMMGGGIGAMHYTGMAAVRLPALLSYQTGLATLSILVAIALAFLSLSVRCLPAMRRLLGRVSLAVSATIMGLAIAGMHYTAMDAAVFFPLAYVQALRTLINPAVLATLITVLAVLVVSIVLAGAFAGRQFETAQSLKEEISRRRQLEREQEQARARLQSIFDSVLDAIVIAGPDGTVRQWSPAATRIFGYSTEEALARPLKLLMPPELQVPQGPQGPRTAEQDDDMDHLEHQLVGRRKDGQPFPLELSASLVRAGDETLYCCVLRDVSARQRVHQELIQARRQADAASQAKSLFLANMSHEVRTPMNAILGMSYLLARSTLPPQQRDYVRKIQQSSRHLLALLDDLLDYAKIEAGQLAIEHIDFDLRETLQAVLDLLADKANAKGLALSLDLAAEVPRSFKGDPLRLSQILINYVNNAIKFTERGLVRLSVRCTGESDGTVALAFLVTDTGIGLTLEQQNRLFQSFQQADIATTRRYGGSGLGLAISKRLAELMGGEVGVRSETGKGSTFWLNLRLEKSRSVGTLHALYSPGDEPALDRHHELHGRRVLLAEDNLLNQEVACEVLHSAGLIVDVVEDGASAVRHAGQNVYDLVLMDLQMKDMDGLHAARLIRANPACQRVPIIAMTASALESDKRACLAAGMNDHVSKPIGPQALVGVVARWIGAGSRDATAERTARPLN